MKFLSKPNQLALADFITVIVIGVILFFLPTNIWPLLALFAFWPWIYRIVIGRPPFQRTPFDILLLLFLVSALVGVWIAYDQSAALTKYGLIFMAILIFYALAGQPPANVWPVVGIIFLVSLLFAVYFLLTHDWQAWPADIQQLTQAGIFWQSFRPSLSMNPLHPNIVGGILAVILPFGAALTWYGWQRRQKWLFLGIIPVGGVVVVAFLLASSRAALVSLLAALFLGFIWYLSKELKRRWQILTLIFLILFCFLILIVFVLLAPTRPITLLSHLLGSEGSTSRLVLAQQELELAGDFPFTGAGLASFAGLYSQYIRVIPFFYFDYGHNFYIDVFLEQGVVGFLSMLGILAGSFWLLLTEPDDLDTDAGVQLKVLRTAIFVGLGTMVLHGFADDALYGISGTPLLFVFPGLAVALCPRRVNQPIITRQNLRNRYFLAAASAVVIIFIFISYRNLVAQWYANLGALAMAQTELAGWPTNKWDDGRHVSELEPARQLFEKALAWQPENGTAHHRLGLIAMLQRDFDTAVVHLEAARQANPDHRGIIKSLGYAYVWSGDLEMAKETLANIPEADNEMGNYVWWWQQQGEEELSNLAATMHNR